MLPSLDIIIVNWNAGVLLQSCLKSILISKKDNFFLSNVVIVDNASQDSSLDNLEEIDLPLKIIRKEKNLGFGYACNQGASGSDAKYLLFLNPDTYLFEYSLFKSISFMEKESGKSIGILGIQLVDKEGAIVRSCTKFPTSLHFFIKILGLDILFPFLFQGYRMLNWDHEESRYVDHVMGSFFLLRRLLFNQLKGFDTRFFLYLEDLDFCLRARRAGELTFYLTDEKAYHEGGGVSKQIKAKRLFYSLRSRILYVYKHFGFVTATLVMLGTIMIEPFTRLIWAGLRGSFRAAVHTVHAYVLLLNALPALLNEAVPKRK
jgi:N-acetylglucosaminyl-diphospho-decaprenol L-rhamnosyltransferase